MVLNSFLVVWMQGIFLEELIRPQVKEYFMRILLLVHSTKIGKVHCQCGVALKPKELFSFLLSRIIAINGLGCATRVRVYGEG